MRKSFSASCGEMQPYLIVASAGYNPPVYLKRGPDHMCSATIVLPEVSLLRQKIKE